MKACIYILLLCLFACKSDVSQSGDLAKDSLGEQSAKLSDTLEYKPTLQEPFILGYAGKDAKLTLIHWGDGQLDGKLRLSGNNKPLELFGEIDRNGKYVLDQYDGLDAVAVLSGELSDLSHSKASLQKLSGEDIQSFDFSKLSPSADGNKWLGAWRSSNANAPGVLIIGNITPTTFDMAFRIVKDGSAGEMTATANYEGKSAQVDQILLDGIESCRLSLMLNAEGIRIEQISSPFDCGFGARANAEGLFVR